MTRKYKAFFSVILILSMVCPLIVFGAARYYMETSPLDTWPDAPLHPELESQLLSQGYFVAHKSLYMRENHDYEGINLRLEPLDFERTTKGTGVTIKGNAQIYQYNKYGESSSYTYWYPGECGQLPYDYDCYDWKFIYQGGFTNVQTGGDVDNPILYDISDNPIFGLDQLKDGLVIKIPRPRDGKTYEMCVEVMAKFVGRVPMVAHLSAATLDSDSGIFTGTVTDTGKPGATEAGFVYSTSNNPATLIRGIAPEVNLAKTDTGNFSVQADGLLPGVTYYIRPYATNKVGSGYGAITSFTVNLPPVVTKVAPTVGASYVGAGKITFDYALNDREGDSLTNTLTLTDSSGATVYSGLPNTINTNTRAKHIYDPSALALSWSSANNRYENTLTATLTANDGGRVGSSSSTITIYNNKPQFTLTTAISTINVNNSEGFTFEGKACDVDGGIVTVKTTVGPAMVQQVLNPAPTSIPGANNFGLTFASIPVGSYTGLTITATDAYGGQATFVWTGTLAVTDTLKTILNGLNDSDYKDTDMYIFAGNTGVTIKQTAGNDATISSISSKLTELDADMALIGLTATKSYLEGNPAEKYILADANRTSNLIDYLGQKLTEYGLNNSSVINTGDSISSSIRFLDTENDYQDIGAAEKPIKYDVMADIFKKWKTGSLKLSYLHEPGVFDNPVTKHAADTAGQLISVTGPSDPAFLGQVTDAMAGRWTMRLAASDWTNTGGAFDKATDPNEVSFICNRLPHAILVLNEDANNFYLDASQSYDLDHQYTQGVNGIVKYEWYYQLEDGSWHKATETSKEMTLSKSIGGKLPIRYGVTVYDYYGAKDSTLKDVDLSLIANLAVDKPYPTKLKTGDPFVATFTITTDETITSVTSWVPNWASSRAMTLQSKVGSVSTYRLNYSVAGGIPDGIYYVNANVKTAEGHDESRVAKVWVLNNLPPDHDSVTITPSPAYSEDTLAATIRFHDPDGDVLTHHVTLTRGGTTVYDQTRTVTPSGLVYPQQAITLLSNAPAGNYTLTSVITDPYGAFDTYTVDFDVRTFIISGTMQPADPMAGDELIFNIHSEGGIDRFQLLLESDVTDNDQRVAMGYPVASYPVSWSVNGADSIKDSELRYILWCTTPQSLTLKGVRNRAPYTFVIRAYIGSVYRDLTFVRDISGDVRQLIKTK